MGREGDGEKGRWGEGGDGERGELYCKYIDIHSIAIQIVTCKIYLSG